MDLLASVYTFWGPPASSGHFLKQFTRQKPEKSILYLEINYNISVYHTQIYLDLIPLEHSKKHIKIKQTRQNNSNNSTYCTYNLPKNMIYLHLWDENNGQGDNCAPTKPPPPTQPVEGHSKEEGTSGNQLNGTENRSKIPNRLGIYG